MTDRITEHHRKVATTWACLTIATHRPDWTISATRTGWTVKAEGGAIVARNVDWRDLCSLAGEI